MTDSDLAGREAARAAAEAGEIGGAPSSNPATATGGVDEAQRPLQEAGEGESEGFEAAESGLVEHASHGDQHAARRVIGDAPEVAEDARAERHEDTRPADR